MDVQEKRRLFLKKQPWFDARRLVFIDECGFRMGSPQLYGWALRGEDAISRPVCGNWKHQTIIGAIAYDGFRGLMTIDSGTSTDVFYAFVTKQLIPNLKPGDIVVMDNLAAHRSTKITNVIHAANAHIIYTPPYSPEFNPIEMTWSKMKNFLRKSITNTMDHFHEAVKQAAETVTLQDRFRWIKHAGYMFDI